MHFSGLLLAIEDEKRSVLRKLLALDEIHNLDVHILQTPLEGQNAAVKHTRDRYLRMVAALFSSVIHLSSTNVVNDAKVFSMIANSEKMNEFLRSPSPISPLIIEVVKSYNSAESYRDRVSILSLIL